MSWRLVERALKTPMKPHIDKLVLLLLADAGRDDGRNCYPSVARLAKFIGVMKRNIQLSLRRLEADGWISVVAPARQHRPTEYSIATARLAQLPEARSVATDTSGQRPGVSPPTPLSLRTMTPGVSLVTPGVSLDAPRGVATDTRSDRTKEEPVLPKGCLSSSQSRSGDPDPLGPILDRVMAKFGPNGAGGPSGCEDPLAPAPAKSGPREAS